jgi:hypothetical protein
METFLDIIQIVVPAALVFFTAYYLLKSFLRAEAERRKRTYKIGNQKISINLKIKM